MRASPSGKSQSSPQAQSVQPVAQLLLSNCAVASVTAGVNIVFMERDSAAAAFARARAGDLIAIARYLGRGESFDRAVAEAIGGA